MFFPSFSLSTSTSLSSKKKKKKTLKQINGITYTLVATDTTVRKGARSLQGLWGEASMPLGEGVTGSVAYDFGGRHSAAAVSASRTLAATGRPVDLAVRWAEKGDALSLLVSTKPHPNHKVAASMDPRSGRALLASWAAEFAVPSLPLGGLLGGGGCGGGGAKPLTLGVTRNFSKSLTTLSAARSVAGAKVVADFSLEDGAAALTVLKAPLRATVKSKRRPAAAGGLSAASWGRPTVSLAIDRELQFDVPWGSRAKPAAKELPKAKGGNPLTDSALFRRLGEIDSLWKGGEKKVEAPVKSWSFLKRA